VDAGTPAGDALADRNGSRAQATARRVFVDRCMELLMRDELAAVVAAMAKLQTTDFQVIGPDRGASD
jgi:hypothetical protein